MKTSFLSVNADAKTSKGTSLGLLTGILYLAPSKESGVMNTCPKASKGCMLTCLFTAGRGAFSTVRQARVRRTVAFFLDSVGFVKDISNEVAALRKKAVKVNQTAVTRLNGTSDIAWENVRMDDGRNIMEMHPDHQFYDYTKRIERVREYAAGRLPSNYHLTFSKSESNDADVAEALALGVNVAVVFHGKTLPDTYLGRPVINGDLHDARYLDPKGVVVGLKAKGKAKKDTTGFVVRVG